MPDLDKTGDGTRTCAENRAAYVARTYGEDLQRLVFFALNNNSGFFNACSGCQDWLCNARGFLKNQNGSWIISTVKPPGWQPNPLSEAEAETLYNAGEEVISDESEAYFRRMGL